MCVHLPQVLLYEATTKAINEKTKLWIKPEWVIKKKAIKIFHLEYKSKNTDI